MGKTGEKRNGGNVTTKENYPASNSFVIQNYALSKQIKTFFQPIKNNRLKLLNSKELLLDKKETSLPAQVFSIGGKSQLLFTFYNFLILPKAF